MPIPTGVSSKKRSRKLSDSFLEAFRDLGAGMAKDARQSLLGSNDSNSQPQNPQELYQKENSLENKYKQQWIRSENIRREEQTLFSREQKETQNQVMALRDEIQSLAKATGNLAKQVEISAVQTPENIQLGSYHINFFRHLKALIKSLRSQINESAMWLESWNKKSKKQNAYWGGVKKSGAKFLLSQDRYVATQAG